MAYEKKARGEDVNAESRTQAATITDPVSPISPQVSSASGGAPKLRRTEWYNEHVVKPKPWQGYEAPAPLEPTVVSNPPWTLEEVAKNERTFVNEFKNLLWDKFQATPESDRYGIFWQGVKQNPELAAASFVRRALENMASANAWATGQRTPTLSQAMRDTLSNMETRQWLQWVRGKGKMPKVGE